MRQVERQRILIGGVESNLPAVPGKAGIARMPGVTPGLVRRQPLPSAVVEARLRPLEVVAQVKLPQAVDYP